VAVGYGESRPLVPNDSEDNRERNRRVEFTILESGGGTAPPKPAVPMPR
jgi:chemotaxis protein MotB